MDANELLLKDEVFQIVGAAMEVLNGVGHGLHEKPYWNLWELKFEQKNLNQSKCPQRRFVEKVRFIQRFPSSQRCPYENALVVEFGIRAIPFQQQPRFDVIYKTVKVSEYVPDLIAYGKVVVDAKVIDRITDHERGKMLNYLRITRLPVGVILNFKRAKLEWERLVLTNRQ